MAEQPANPKETIVLIHGLWMTPLCWEEWIPYLESKGYEVIAPGWPGIDGRSPQEIRADPQSIASATIEKIVDRYASVIQELPSPPIIIGHSFGGLFTQILLSRGLGRAGIALSPAQPAGIFSLPFSTVKITENQFHYCFGNHLTPEKSKTLWDRYSIPSVAHVLWEGALGGLKAKGPAHVDFRRECRAPLLLVAGTNDHVVPKSTVEKEFAAYDKTGQAVVELKVFEGRTHGIVNEEGWNEVADYAIEFALKHAKN
jgi:non-heme chloroperoxidase